MQSNNGFSSTDPNFGSDQSDEFVASGNDKADEEDYLGAIADFERAIELNPKNLNAYFNRAVALQVLEEFEQSAEDLNRVIAGQPTDAQAYFFRGIAFDELEQYDAAMSDYDKTLVLDPTFVEAYIYRAELLLLMNKEEAALYDYNIALTMIDQDYPDLDLILFNRGLAKFHLGDKPGACQDWKQSKQLGNEDAAELLKQHC
jgi:tetratricopeptide (TPR) repeat protein